MGHVGRRRFLAAASALAAVPLCGRAQSATSRRFRIALFPELYAEERKAFIAVLEERGWREGRDFAAVAATGHRFAPLEAASIAKQIVAEHPDVVVTKGTNRALAIHRASRSVPIVMLSSGYPVEAGLALSLARPGKSVTGNSIYAGTGVFGKFLELLREAKPGTRRVGVLWGYVPPVFPRAEIDPVYAVLRQSAADLTMAIDIVEIAALDRLGAGLTQLEAKHPDAILVTSSFARVANGRPRIMKFAIEQRLPTISDSPWPPAGSPGPLLAYGARRADLARQAAEYVFRILNGERPGELPIQQPARFDLVVNLGMAKAIGLEMPKSMLLRADRVID